MKHCSNCRFWKKIRDIDYKLPDEETIWYGPHGECIKIDMFPMRKNAWLDSFPVFLDEEVRDIVGLRAETDTTGNKLESEASLITKPDFGCSLWEKGKFKYFSEMTDKEKIAWRNETFEDK